MKQYRLNYKQVKATQSINSLGFTNTNSLKEYEGILGQERAIKAIEFGLEMDCNGYNIYVMGQHGTGRMSYIKRHLESISFKNNRYKNIIFDWIYLNNFKNMKHPLAIQLPCGTCSKLKKDFNQFIDKLLFTFPAAFENPHYQMSKNLIEREFTERYENVISKIEHLAIKQDIMLFREEGTLSFTPMVNNKPIDETEFAQLPTNQKTTFNKNIADLELKLNDALTELPQWKREIHEHLQELNYETIDHALEPLMNNLIKKYQFEPKLLEYFQEMKEHLHRTILKFSLEEKSNEYHEDSNKRKLLETLYLPNFFIAHNNKPNVPIIHESHPTYSNLFGRVEHSHDNTISTTNHQNIFPGAIHKANGGYLILEANKLLSEPYSWEGLKRFLQEKSIKIESSGNELLAFSNVTLTPETIDLHLKVILIGSRETFYTLKRYDSEFDELFRVVADFEDYFPKNETNIKIFAQLFKHRAREKNYPGITASAINRFIEYSCRLSEHQNLLSAEIKEPFDLLSEANFIRQQTKDKYINHHHVDSALRERKKRIERVQKQLLQETIEHTILINTTGSKIGVINILTVISTGDFSFGAPARITATAYPGNQGIVDIEREVSLGQPIHSKGVLILTGFIGHNYAVNFPLTFSANITVEQSYGKIDGDSASLAELCCLLSALAQQPIKQNIAITGSINQYGEVQSIGGVNEKIESFFELTQARKKEENTLVNGVIIPKSNVINLMLNDEVVTAIKEKKFDVYAVETVDEALAILFDIKVGKKNNEHHFTKGSLHDLVQKRLKTFYKISKQH